VGRVGGQQKEQFVSTATLDKPVKVRPEPIPAPPLDPKTVAKLGQTVLWYRHMDRDMPPTPAVIHQGGHRVNLVVFQTLLNGVPHSSDPIVEHLKAQHETENGFWEHTEDTLWLIDLKNKIEKADKK